MEKTSTPKYYVLSKEKLQKLKDRVEADPQKYYLIIFGKCEPKCGLPNFWDVVYRQDKGWLTDITHPEFRVHYRRLEAEAGFIAVIITEENKLQGMHIDEEYAPSRDELEAELAAYGELVVEALIRKHQQGSNGKVVQNFSI